MKLKAYTITSREARENLQCSECGWPFDAGERYWAFSHGGGPADHHAFCSLPCADDFARRDEWRATATHHPGGKTDGV